MKYDRLFEQGNIGDLIVKNRFMMAPMGNNFGSLNEAVSQRQIDYYERRAQGGVGLIITESCPVELLGRHGRDRIQIYLDNSVESLSRLTAVVHRYGAKIAFQLTHGGFKCSPALIGEFPLAPSSIPIAKKDFIPRSLTRQSIAGIIANFAGAARKSLLVDCDAIELLAASGHLIHQFLSPVSNRRNDAYGGSLQNRMRFLLEIIEAVKAATQDRLPILVKLVGKDPENAEGTRIDVTEFPEMASLLYRAGVASIHLSTNFSAEPERERRDLFQLARRIRERTPVKIAVAGSIFHPKEGEGILKDGIADFIEMGRAFLAEPDFVNKVFAGREDQLRPCLNCNHCRFETGQKRPIKCSVNPFLGKEGECAQAGIAPAKKVAIIGGGPAGMQAAIVLSQLGHCGTVFEQESRLGGLLWAASVAPDKGRMGQFITFLAGQVKETGFETRIGQAIQTDAIRDFLAESWDAVVVALGAKPFFPKMLAPACPNLYLAADILAQKRPLKGTVVVLGAGQVGCEVADFLSEQGEATQVILMATSLKIAANVIPQERTPLLKRLGNKGVRMLVNVLPEAFDGKILQYKHNECEKTIECAAVIIAKGWEANPGWKSAIEANFKGRVYLIGDAAAPRSLLEAMEEGVAVALEINNLP
jgi:2,4-dienoyl-CoA reductase-like NADH-dependent reductase (Old Yellow Enzyme family)/thioredoxin reductase